MNTAVIRTCQHMLGGFAGVSSFEACVIKHSPFSLIMLPTEQVRSHNTELTNVQLNRLQTCFGWVCEGRGCISKRQSSM